MSDNARTYVRIDTGYGPPGRVERPIELHGGDCDGVSRLTMEEAEALSGQLASAAHAVRVLTAATAARHARQPEIVLGSYVATPQAHEAGLNARCPKCGDYPPPGVLCRQPECPRNPTHRPRAEQE